MVWVIQVGVKVPWSLGQKEGLGSRYQIFNKWRGVIRSVAESYNERYKMLCINFKGLGFSFVCFSWLFN